MHQATSTEPRPTAAAATPAAPVAATTAVSGAEGSVVASGEFVWRGDAGDTTTGVING